MELGIKEGENPVFGFHAEPNAGLHRVGLFGIAALNGR